MRNDERDCESCNKKVTLKTTITDFEQSVCDQRSIDGTVRSRLIMQFERILEEKRLLNIQRNGNTYFAEFYLIDKKEMERLEK